MTDLSRTALRLKVTDHIKYAVLFPLSQMVVRGKETFPAHILSQPLTAKVGLVSGETPPIVLYWESDS